MAKDPSGGMAGGKLRRAVIFLLLAGMVAWSILGTVEATDADGSTEEIHPITLVTN